ncbi:type III secretion system YscD/HrpQ family protein [Variovorax sp. TBS-050B]|uniref:forkhead-associated protein n=1 Tax=Variovorax sp. TBS-050B TaxID=2940551 RepID=UPI002472F1E3|nr:forkhead-associated protein [Variovorax sp. TBS-050B]MDH6594272.1 type III secretion system YscD/HrpQ family protein [Variovorax sp. TBS-050B]
MDAEIPFDRDNEEVDGSSADDASGARAAADAPHAHAQAAGWCLRFLSGAVKGRTIVLRPGINVLGSGGECEVMLPGGDVLPRHLAFTVGELVVSMQRLGTASARLNGEEMQQPRKSVVAGDIVSVGQIDIQLDRTYPASPQEDRMFAPAHGALPEGEALARPPASPAQRLGLWVGGVFALLAVLGLAAVSLGGSGTGAAGGGSVNLAEVEKALVPFPEVEVIAAPGGQFGVKGYVESKQRRKTLEDAMARFGSKVSVNVHAAEDMVEQARRYVGDPGVAVTYTGQGRLVLSGTVEDESVRRKIQRLGEDLHPSVLVSDKVQYREKPKAEPETTDVRAQWDAWQSVLPARMVSITEDGEGLRHIQLSNGNRYYEGSVLRSGAELKRIDADGLVLSGGVPNNQRKPAR